MAIINTIITIFLNDTIRIITLNNVIIINAYDIIIINADDTIINAIDESKFTTPILIININSSLTLKNTKEKRQLDKIKIIRICIMLTL